MFRFIFLGLIIIHGSIHALGFVKAFNLGKIEHLTQAISRPIGLLWLLSAMIFVLSAIPFAFGKNWWSFLVLVAIILSQFLIILSWSDAKFGTIPNLIMLVVALVSIGAFMMHHEFASLVKNDFANNNTLSTENLTEKDISHLPTPVQKYLRYTKSVGKPKIKNFRAEFTGGMRSNPDDKFMKLNSVQYNFYEEPSRYFYMSASKMGLPATGLHIYKNKTATFQVKLLNWIPVVDAKGNKMNQAETVTLFNDMCFIAPATLIDRRIVWESVDNLAVKASYTNGSIIISAILYFNEKGELVNFISHDRYDTDGKRYDNYPWKTPVEDYKEINGYLLPSKVKLIYQRPDGDFTYGELEYRDVKYNLSRIKL